MCGQKVKMFWILRDKAVGFTVYNTPQVRINFLPFYHLVQEFELATPSLLSVYLQAIVLSQSFQVK